MRWFAAHPEPVIAVSASAPRVGRRPFKTALLALAFLAGVGFSAGERFEARAADDGGMMSFLLGGNAGGRARAAAPQFRFDPPAFRRQATVARKIAPARHNARGHTTRPAFARPRVKQPDHAIEAAGAKRLIQKASYETTVDVAKQKTIARTLALKAAAAAVRPDDAHLNDKTLRRGDIVATAAGLRVFRGSGQFPYRARDFAPISAARHVAQRPVLEALDRSLRGVRLVARSQIQKRVAKAEDRPGASGAGQIRRVDAAPPAPRTVAFAYAPRAEAGQAKTATPAIAAIERVVRRIDAPAAARQLSNRPESVAAPARAAAKKIE